MSFKIIPRQKDQVQIPSLWAGHLLFLKSRKDGRFEAVTGQIDPQYSVRELRLPPTVE